MSPPKLAIVVTEFPKITETFTMREAMELRRLGVEVRIYYLTRFRKNEIIHDFAKPLVADSRGCGYFLDPRILKSFLGRCTRHPLRVTKLVATLVAEFWRRPDLLAKSLLIVPKCLWFADDMVQWGAAHVHASFAGHPATAAWIVSRVEGTPYSISCHAHDILLSQLMLATKFRNAHMVRAISKFNAAFLQSRLGCDACRNLVVLHCGVDTRTRAPRTTDPALGFRILFVGALEPRKGVDVLLHSLYALRNTPNWTCRIAGGGALRNPLETLARQLGLESRVSFLGGQSAEQVSRLQADSDLLVVPSIQGPGGRSEGIPVVIMEGFNQGCAVIATRLTGIPELVRDGDTGLLVEPGDSAGLADAIRRMMRSSSQARTMAARGQALVEEEFSLQKNVVRLLALMSIDADPAGTKAGK